MKRQTKTKILMILFVVILLSFFNIHTISAKKTVRVAYPIQKGMTMKDDDNNYYGYDYDYLMQIAQYTGWSYEFVEVEGTLNERLTTLMSMLEDGEIDLIGGMRYNEALSKKFDYPSESYGNAYNIIAVEEDSKIYDLNALLDFENLRIAVLESASKRIEKLDQFALMNGFTFEKVVCKDEVELTQAIKDNKADAILTVDLSKPDAYHSIARFSPDSFYFATTKGNSEIIAELNQALDKIRDINPTLSSTLYNRYFDHSTQTFRLSDEEQAYINTIKTVQVLVRDGVAPIEYIDIGETKGIAKDILDAISQNSGLQFEYIYASSYEDYAKKLKEGIVDLTLGIPYEMSVAETLGLSLSEPFMANPVALVTRRGVDPSSIESFSQGVTQYSNQHYDNNKNLTYYDTPAEILHGIESGDTGYTYINQYLYTYYLNKYQYNDLVSFQTPDYFHSQYSFGVKNDKDNLMLLSILNKGIRSTKDQMETYIYKNGYIEKDYSISAFIRDNLVFISVFFLFLISLTIFGIWFYYQDQLKMKKEVEMEYQRYLQLAEISGEMTFSYDYRNDELKLSPYSLHRLANYHSLSPFLATTQPSALTIIQTLLDKREDSTLEMQFSLLDRMDKWYAITLKIIKDNDRSINSHAIYAVGKIQDIQDEYEKREDLHKKSQTDELTSLLNRRGAQAYIPDKIKNESGYLIMIDLDNFKDINDTYGHLDGDIVLKETADILKMIFTNASVARLGGDEFLIYVSEISESKLKNLCQKALTSIVEIPYCKDKDIQLHMSIGAVSTALSDDYSTLLKFADESLYYVKRNGRNNYHLYNESMHSQ